MKASNLYEMVEPATLSPDWVCPVHKLELAQSGTTLVCPEGDSYHIRNDIPRFVPERTYADSFGAQWRRYRLTQLDSFSGLTITADRARRCAGEELWSELKGMNVLECGCGAGRFTEVLLKQGATVTSCDLSDAVDANKESFPINQKHRIMQADILKLPFRPQGFDVVFCLGVLQYTADPESAIKALYEQVKPGGKLVIDCYAPCFAWYTKTAPLFRYYLRTLPPDQGLRFTERMVDLFLPLHKRVRNYRLLQMALSRISPVSCYYQSYPSLSDEQHKDWALLDTHNSLTGWYRHSRTKEQIVKSLKDLGLTDIRCAYGGNGVEASGRRPAK
jgi:2-polyprenyl-3-methyl-5-hydroxy-6-metoxy-1,4-benzoquinol methylase